MFITEKSWTDPSLLVGLAITCLGIALVTSTRVKLKQAWAWTRYYARKVAKRTFVCRFVGHNIEPDCGALYCLRCWHWSSDQGKTWHHFE